MSTHVTFPEAAGGLPAADSRIATSRGTNQTGIGQTPTDVLFDTEEFNVGGWTRNLSTGEITVPAGVTHVNICVRILWTNVPGTRASGVEILINGSGLENISGYGLFGRGGETLVGASSGIDADLAVSNMVPVSEGDVIKVQAQLQTTGTADIVAGSHLYVEKAA